jgi:ubiquinone biosynthesis protein COQ9
MRNIYSEDQKSINQNNEEYAKNRSKILGTIQSLIYPPKTNTYYIDYQQSDLKYYVDFLKNPENATKTTKKSSDDVVYYSNNPTTDEDNNII